jgi:hypothetical protein
MHSRSPFPLTPFLSLNSRFVVGVDEGMCAMYLEWGNRRSPLNFHHRCLCSAWPEYSKYKTNKNKFRGLSPQANYTDWLSDRRLSAKLVPTLADRGCHVVSATNPPQSLISIFETAPQLSSWGWVDPVPDPLLLRKSGSAGNRNRTSGSVARNSDH